MVAPNHGLARSALARLPSSLREQIHIAAINADYDRLMALADQLAGLDADSARFCARPSSDSTTRGSSNMHRGWRSMPEDSSYPDSGASILVVDDTPANLQVLVGMLKERGHRVRPVLEGRLALRAAKAEVPDLVCSTSTCPT